MAFRFPDPSSRTLLGPILPRLYFDAHPHYPRHLPPLHRPAPEWPRLRPSNPKPLVRFRQIDSTHPESCKEKCSYNHITPVVYVIHKSLTVCQTSNLTPTRQRVAILHTSRSHLIGCSVRLHAWSCLQPVQQVSIMLPCRHVIDTPRLAIQSLHHKSLQPTCNSTCELC